MQPKCVLAVCHVCSCVLFCTCLSQQSGLIYQCHSKGGVGGGVYNKVQYNNISVYVWSLLTLLLPCLDGGKRPLHDISAAKVSFSASLLVTIHFYIHAQEACAKACRCSHGENSSMLAFYSAYELYA